MTGGAEAKAVPSSDPALEQRFRDTRNWATQVHQKNLELQKQLAELQQQVQAIQQAPAKSAEPKTQPWDPEDPRYSQFLRYHDRAEFYEELIEGESDQAEIAKLQDKMRRVLGPEGVQMLRDWRTDVRNQERERRMNPKAFYSKIIRQEAQPVVRETLQSTSQIYQDGQRARDEARKWVQDNPEIATPENIQKALKLMESGMPFRVASMAVEREHYRTLVSNAKKVAASAEEKERLLQGNAAGAISRNPNASKKLDVKKFMADKGLDKMDSRARIDALFELDQQGML